MFLRLVGFALLMVLVVLIGAGLLLVTLSDSLIMLNRPSDAFLFFGFVQEVLSFLLIVATVIFLLLTLYKKMRNVFSTLSLLLCLLVGSVSLTSCVEPIDVGNVGVKFDKTGDSRGVNKVEEVSGWVWYNPITTKVIEIPVTMETVSYEAFPVTVKGSEFSVAPVINYHVDPSKASDMYVKFRRDLPQIENGYLNTSILEATRSATDGFTADSMANSRTSYEAAARALLQKEIGQYGFVVDQFTSNLTLPPGLKHRIEARNESLQATQLATNQALQAIEQAKVIKARANGAADSLRVMADAKAYYNTKLQQTLTPLLIEQQRIQKWDGAYPTYMTSGASSTLLSIK